MSSEDKNSCRAWRINNPGNVVANLELVTIPCPSAEAIGKNEVLVRVTSASIWRGDWWPIEMGGASKIMGVSFPRSPGMDFGGHVVAVGRKVVGVEPGDAVFGRMDPLKQGSLSKYVVAPFDGVAVLQRGISPREAGAAGTASLAAYQSIVPYVQEGDNVFINGGSGGVGTFAIQIAKALGCHVTITCSTDKVPLCSELGADSIINYNKENVMAILRQRGKVFAHVVDNVVGSPSDLFPGCDDIMLPGKKRYYVSVGSGINVSSVLNTNVGTMLPSWLGGSKHKWKPLVVANSREDLAQIAKWMAEKKVRTVVDSTFAFNEVPDAFSRHKKGSMAGKILIDVAVDATGMDKEE
ncbi:uncharacterized protein J7T54_002849 [Emericellopsis cladophorae]|uniref:Enoyl reductase (ER) domain-containing protein n=1 Tax=Emericellopsis cladophorae TaxID=2686198 RepID=A0A9P9XZM1_9HYPO|nr:uncharacterized protein J7T54_002849 [Emericellopsis cladophorae]KAI6780453.1 hypothetical protein J7T54_002849 [Emericellopsis cladophorae]